MERPELDELVERRQNGLRDKDGILEDLGAVENAVPDGIDVLRRAEIGDDLLERLRVILRAAATDAFDKPLGETLPLLHVEELIFERRRT